MYLKVIRKREIVKLNFDYQEESVSIKVVELRATDLTLACRSSIIF